MSLRPRWLAFLFLTALFGAALVALNQAGFWPVVMLTHTAKTLFTRADADYDRLEADRLEQQVGIAGNGVPQLGREGNAYWTGYRGARGDGIYAERELASEWPAAGPPRLWRQPSGGGWASFAIAKGLAVTLEQRRDDEAVVAYGLESGSEVWVHRYPARFEETISGEGPRATPVITGDQVVALGATGELRCLALATGELRWQRNVLADGAAGNLTYALSASPIAVRLDGGEALPGSDENQDTPSVAIIVLTGAPESDACVHAFSVGDGERLWSALPEDGGAYATPTLAEIGGSQQLVVATASRIVGLRPDDGALLWESPWSVQSGLTIAQPIVLEDDRVLVSSGYGAGAVMLQVTRMEQNFQTEAVWRSKRLKTKFNSAVHRGDYVYGLDEGTMTCVELATGKRIWKGGRYGYGQMLLAGDGILVISESGEVARVTASPDGFEETGRFEAIEGTTWNVPALAEGLLLVRNAAEMACFDLNLPDGASPVTAE